MTAAHFSETADNETAGHAPATLPPLRVTYEHVPLDRLFAARDVLAIIGFGRGAPAAWADARYLHVPLEPLQERAPFEVWRASARVRTGRDGEVRWASDGDYAFAAIEVDESRCDGIGSAARHAYAVLGDWLASAPTAHVLRIWNYLDAINGGDGDAERYRQFCHGRAEGMRTAFVNGFPAATAIGVRDGRRIIRVYGIAARIAGVAIENPRQVSAWRYPRQYGPSAPTFARAMHAPTLSPQLYISGTAAIVGHASHHRDDFAAQLGETLANLDSLLDAAAVPTMQRFGGASLLKAYLRRGEDATRALATLRPRLHGAPLLMLQGDICRRELLIEIDGIQSY